MAGTNETITLTVLAKDLASGNIGGLIGKLDALAKRGGLAGNVMQGIGLSIGTMLNPVGLVMGAIQGLGSVIGQSVQDASNLNETITKSDVIFGSNADEIEAWAETAAQAFGQSKRQALDTASGFAGLFQTVGIAAQQSTDYAQKLTGLGSDLASFFNTDVQTAIDSLKSGLSGESEPLRKFNVFLSETAVKAKLTAMGIKSVAGNFTEAQKATARYALIMEQTSVAQGDFANTSDGLANSQRIVAAEQENLRAKIGKGIAQLEAGLMPALSGVIDLTGKLVDGIGELGTAFDNLHRFADPKYAHTQDLEDAFRAQAEAAGFTAKQVDDYIAAQKAAADADAKAAAATKLSTITRERSGFVNGQWVQGLDSATASTKVNTDALNAEAAAMLAQMTRQRQAADANASYASRYGVASHFVAATAEETAKIELDAYNARASAAINEAAKSRAANRSVIEGFLTLGPSIHKAMTDALDETKQAMKDLRWTIRNPDAWKETRATLNKEMREATHQLAVGIKKGQPEVIAQAEITIAAIQAKLDALKNINVHFTSTFDAGGGPHVSGAGRAVGGPTPTGIYTVGEHGRETLVVGPGFAGIDPRMGGSGGRNVTLQVIFQSLTTPTEADGRKLGAALMPHVVRAMRGG